VSLARFDGDRPVLGVIHDPIRGETFTAAEDSTPSLNGRELNAAPVERVDQAFVHLTVDFHQGTLQEGLRDLTALAPRVLRTRNIGSAALALAYVATGRFDAMVHRFANPWDYAAGAAIILRRGGVITNLEGKPYTPETTAVLAASGPDVHAALLKIVQDGPDAHVECRERADPISR
jgi:myo-inositol-1(or 4)-monophosphatase